MSDSHENEHALNLSVMIFIKWLTEDHSTAISISAAFISAGALVVAAKAYRLNRQVAERAGRLKHVQVTKVAAGTQRYSRGFKAVNGPNEITITDAMLCITYHVTEMGEIWYSHRHVRYLRATSLGLLGIDSPALPVRLLPYDEKVWKLPPWHVLAMPAEVTIAGSVYSQCVHLQLRVSTSGDILTSDELTTGGHAHTPRHSTDIWSDTSLEELLVSTRNDERLIGLHEWLKKLIIGAAT